MLGQGRLSLTSQSGYAAVVTNTDTGTPFQVNGLCLSTAGQAGY